MSNWDDGDWQARPRTVTLRNARAVVALFECVRMLSPQCRARATETGTEWPRWDAVELARLRERMSPELFKRDYHASFEVGGLAESGPSGVRRAAEHQAALGSCAAPLPGSRADIEAAARSYVHAVDSSRELFEAVRDRVPVGGVDEALAICRQVWNEAKAPVRVLGHFDLPPADIEADLQADGTLAPTSSTMATLQAASRWFVENNPGWAVSREELTGGRVKVRIATADGYLAQAVVSPHHGEMKMRERLETLAREALKQGPWRVR